MVNHTVRIEGVSLMRRSRIFSLQALYQLYFYEDKKSITTILQELYDIYREDFKNKNLDKIINIKFIENLIQISLTKKQDNFTIIEGFLQESWQIDDISPLLSIILQLSSTEICYTDTDLAVIINEYIEITKMFGNSKEAKFINNILEQVSHKCRDNG